MKDCRCGECEEQIPDDKVWAVGHDLRAVMRVVRDNYGTAEKFVDFHEGRIT